MKNEMRSEITSLFWLSCCFFVQVFGVRFRRSSLTIRLKRPVCQRLKHNKGLRLLLTLTRLVGEHSIVARTGRLLHPHGLNEHETSSQVYRSR